MVPSSDHRYLYVVVDGAARVRRFDLTTETSDLAIDVDLGLVADDLAPLHGLPRSIAFTRLIPNSTGNAAMVVYDNSVLRFSAGISYLIQPGEDATTLYSFDTGFTTSVTRFARAPPTPLPRRPRRYKKVRTSVSNTTRAWCSRPWATWCMAPPPRGSAV